MNNLYNFTNGDIADNYTIKEERGFPIQGAIGSILNSNDNVLKNINDGLFLNIKNKTDHSHDMINTIFPRTMNHDGLYSNPHHEQPDTPLLYCDTSIKTSELLEQYPNGVPNKFIAPNCFLKVNNVLSPTLYGASTFGLNDVDILNNPNNNIGHEIENFGSANKYGSRAIGQGRNACKELMPGYNVPSLYTNNNNNSYISEPGTFDKDVPLYQVGDWTKQPDNFMYEFNNTNYCSN